MHTQEKGQKAIETLKARSDFLAAQNKGQKWVSQSFVLQIHPNNLGLIRTGYTVSKKVDKSAVKRNRIKRRLRAVAAEILNHNAKNGYDYVLIGRKSTGARPFKTLLNDLKWCLKKTGFYQTHDQNTNNPEPQND